MPNFDLSNLALQSLCPNNEILYDDKGLPSVMVKIPKMTYANLGLGSSTDTHPAFIINGTEVDAIYISKYQNMVYNGRAYSLPGRDPNTFVTYDTAILNCKTKGDGWHLMTRAEWALIALYCKRNGFQPLGNNNHGKDSTESIYRAIPTSYTGTQINRVATGTGPLTWSHDNTISGIWDLNGNVAEWVGGVRTVYGELQVLADNNAADNTKSQTASSAEWKAIDATTGEYITPNGSGTTTNSIKIDWVSNNATFSSAITTQANTNRTCLFASVTTDSSIGVDAKLLLNALALLPTESTAAYYNGDYLYFNNGAAERSFFCGGFYDRGASTGVFCAYGLNTRPYAGGDVGFRSAYCELPSA